MSLDYSPLLQLFPNSDNAATAVPWQDRIDAYLSGVVADWAEDAGIINWEEIDGFEIEVEGITSNNGQVSVWVRIRNSSDICRLDWILNSQGLEPEIRIRYLAEC